MRLVLVTAPVEEPVDINEAKAWLHVDAADEDALITSLIAAGRRRVEQETNRLLITQTWRMDLDRFPCARQPILVPYGPVTAINSITYRDGLDVAQTLPTGDYQTDGPPGDYVRILPAVDGAWPDYRTQPGALQVEFDAGYGDASAVPDDLKIASLLLVAHWFTNRSAVGPNDIMALPMAAEAILHGYRIPLLA